MLDVGIFIINPGRVYAMRDAPLNIDIKTKENTNTIFINFFTGKAFPLVLSQVLLNGNIHCPDVPQQPF